MTAKDLLTLKGAANVLEQHHYPIYASLLRQLLDETRLTPTTWQEIETFDGRASFVLVQDGEEVYRAACQSDGWRCEEGYRVHPTHWMPFAQGPPR